MIFHGDSIIAKEHYKVLWSYYTMWSLSKFSKHLAIQYAHLDTIVLQDVSKLPRSALRDLHRNDF